MSIQEPALTLRKDALGVLSIVLLVIATNGPLTVIVGATPAAMAFGNGIGLPSVFLLIGLVYLVFSVGFAAMAHHIKNAGAFYAYVSNGLGHPTGVGTAFMAIVAYASLNLALYGMFGTFGAMFFTRITGIELPWWMICAGFVLIVHMFASRNIVFNGRVLGALMLAEVGIALLFNAGVLFQGPGPDGWVMESFHPSQVFTPGFGSAVVFVIAAFMGFETAAIYSEEARNPKRNIPIALFLAVVIITLLDGSATWFMISAYGKEQALDLALNSPGTIWFDIVAQVLGGWAATAMEMLMITSLFAAILSFQNTLSRYFFALGREGILWSGFAKLHPKQQSPYIASGWFLNMDAPEHFKLRQVVAKIFSPTGVKTLAHMAATCAEELVLAAKAKGEVDFAKEVAQPYPVAVICDILGAPASDRKYLHGLTVQALAGDVPEICGADKIPAVFAEMNAYGANLSRKRRKAPKDDVVSMFIAAEVDGRKFTDDEVGYFFQLLVTAGMETTGTVGGHAMRLFIENPDQMQIWANDPDGVSPTGLEELVRLVSPVRHMRRTAAIDVEIAGQKIAAGDKVVMWYGSGNRDETIFANPDVMDVRRNPNPHIAFGGGGRHTCLGAHLARLELPLLIKSALTHLKSPELTGPPVFVPSRFANGLASLPIRFAA